MFVLLLEQNKMETEILKSYQISLLPSTRSDNRIRVCDHSENLDIKDR